MCERNRPECNILLKDTSQARIGDTFRVFDFIQSLDVKRENSSEWILMFENMTTDAIVKSFR